ncbi:unnamed protein product [Rotaria magnacalcarata]|uniref:Uncharacterized protein n=2 Tax=Rotaria magnacalcarata TaxID=392030 RepID=A0A816N2I1_9BILA|nr:unnamed protein product [Rotaria magnacalcarata]
MFSIVYAFLYPILHSLFDETRAQICQSASQYEQCSSNTACACLRLMNTVNDGICAYLRVKCSELISCANNNRTCYRPDHICVNHSRCHSTPLCYPIDMTLQIFCPPIPSMTTPPPPVIPDDGICASATWNQNGVTVAGGNGRGSSLDQLNEPLGLFVDEDAAVYVADTLNFRVVKWASGASSGQVVAGGNGEGNQTNQMKYATKIIIDKNGTMFICDHTNMRVQRWFKNDDHGQTIIENISCWGLALDKEESLYVSDWEKLRIMKWPSEEIVAGGNGQGSALNQLFYPCDVFIDQDQSIFVADDGNQRIIKWPVGAKEGIVVAGHNQLESPQSVVVDQMGAVYAVDYGNHVVRWLKDAASGSIIISQHGAGNGTDELSDPTDLAFDRQGNLYVVDRTNSRVQMFTIDKSSCDRSMHLKILLI